MSRRRHPAPTPVFNDVDAALGTMSAEELREVVRDMLLELDEKAATLLAAAPDLGWSNSEHPGHLLFPLFAGLLGGTQRPPSLSTELLSHRGMGIDELELMTGDGDEPRLSTPEIEQILRTAGIDAIPKAGARGAVLVAMRKAAESRLAGVTDQKRRRHYGHAAELVAVCLGCDRSPDTARWAALMRTEYQRFPALRAEIDRALGSP